MSSVTFAEKQKKTLISKFNDFKVCCLRNSNCLKRDKAKKAVKLMYELDSLIKEY